LNVQWSANHTFLDPGTPEAANTDAAAEPGAQPPAALTDTAEVLAAIAELVRGANSRGAQMTVICLDQHGNAVVHK